MRDLEREIIRRYLGITKLLDLPTQLNRMEKVMANAEEQLTELRDAFLDFRDDVSAKLDQLVAAQGELEPAAQAVFDELRQAVADADTAVGDADGSDGTTTQPTEPTEPPVDNP